MEGNGKKERKIFAAVAATRMKKMKMETWVNGVAFGVSGIKLEVVLEGKRFWGRVVGEGHGEGVKKEKMKKKKKM